MPRKPPLRYDFEVTITPESVRIRSQILQISRWSRTRTLPQLMHEFSRHVMIHTRMNRRLIPTRISSVVDDTSLRFFVYTA